MRENRSHAVLTTNSHLFSEFSSLLIDPRRACFGRGPENRISLESSWQLDVVRPFRNRGLRFGTDFNISLQSKRRMFEYNNY